MEDFFGQSDHRVRCDWGPVGARAVGADVAVVVDVLSFSTSVTVAVERGSVVYPFPWRDHRATQFAQAHDAVLAIGRLEAAYPGAPPAPTLSPAGLLTGPAVERLVLPSPNGSHIANSLIESGTAVAAGCLRNAGAVARWCAEHLRAGRSVAVIAAGERWRYDDSLRPCLEDLLGAGAVVQALAELGYGDVSSPEASAAAAVYNATKDRVEQVLLDSVGGRELVSQGFGQDVAVAASVDASQVVPVLIEGAFRAA